MIKKQSLIIDAYSSASLLAPEILSFNILCDHLNSRKKIPKLYKNSFRPYDFTSLYESVDSLLNEKKRYDFILGGCDYSTPIVDKLGEVFNIPTRNPLKTTDYRRDKFLMIERLKKVGLAWVNQIKSSSIMEIKTWLLNTNRKYPIVVKPLKSAGTDNVTICMSFEDALMSVNKVLSSENIYKEKNDEALLMEYLGGREFIVDTVSYDGSHLIVAIFQVFKKKGRTPVLDYMLLENFHSSFSKDLIVYSKKILSALELQYGPAHLEIVITPIGPHLIELNPRFHGHLNPYVMNKAFGFNQIRLTAEIYCHRFFPNYINASLKKQKGWVLKALIHSSKRLRLTSRFPWVQFTRLTSYQSSYRWRNLGDYTSPTTSLKSALGMVYLFHREKKIVEQDYKIIRDLENCFFNKHHNIVNYL
ncbi:MAG: ATP-grasp domain-containing protein [Oligoflexia bacterium]|nr:ATP-grasp domain-containing protein [Oligoflexia bacterium]